ncbi:MAG: glycine cleavage system protein GcvH [Planctomycetota bacterium]|nr:glycine cleavage system protein GcvH [Planctomycetota bacterium]
MANPTDRVYSKTHEWHKVEGDHVTLGLTQFAVDALTEVTYVEMKKPGTKFKAGESIGVVESVKTTSDVYCACAGEIVEVNQALANNPGLLNSDSYGQGWLCRIKIADKSGLDGLLSAEKYTAEHP